MFFVSLIQGSLNYPFWGNQTIQIFGNFDGFPLKPCVWVGNIMTPVISSCLERSKNPFRHRKSDLEGKSPEVFDQETSEV